MLLDYLIYLFFVGRDLQLAGIEEIEVGVEGHGLILGDPSDVDFLAVRDIRGT